MPDSGNDPAVLIDDPAPLVRRFTLNRPAKRNAMNDALRGQLFEGLRAGDRARDVSVMIIRGSGTGVLGRLRPGVAQP